MVRSRRPKKGNPPQEQSILDMDSSEARKFLLKPESYCSIDLPPYLRFDQVLSNVSKAIGNKKLLGMQRISPGKCEGVNYPLLSNKDGRYAWRPLQLIHPALYVSLVNDVTTESNWEGIRKRFSTFQALDKIRCLSIPVRSRTGRKDQATRIRHWWQGIEQGSVELALDYAYVLHADITDCYAAIYTHSIAWALHGKPLAKERRPEDDSLIGNVIDRHIQNMRYGQTNGIPQGSVLMDLIAEMVLGYADLELSSRLKKDGIGDYQILRYRDDYRIFANNPRLGEAILKALTEVLIGPGLKLNTAKTTSHESVVSSSLKPDKVAWLRSKQDNRDLQKYLLLIHAHGLDYPNSGSLVVALTHFYECLSKAKTIKNPRSLISIAVDIAYRSPRIFPVCAAITSKVLSTLESDAEKVDLIRRIHKKLSQMPNTGHMEIWLQRISHPYDRGIALEESLCQLVNGKEDVRLWNNEWISAKQLLAALNPKTIVDMRKLKSLKPVVPPAEIKLFSYERY
ncbi:MAG: RNA-directed DNA polymerase [Candidatus Omnitrophica bacterium]|nr:RNA-directed DNA polymerase [Candidatus Omnitrophota bacterium]